MQFDEDYLGQVGLGEMPEERKAEFLRYIQETLEIRVGQRMSEGMSDAKLLEFDELAKGGDTEEIQEWIKVNRPDYREIARDELRKVTEELIERKSEILVNGKA